ncbi:MAG TPA: SAM-dependent methyltransferase [Terriglobales bacterium]|nr:SAM-dependent methyltransferase [Terriglobales bacterium]
MSLRQKIEEEIRRHGPIPFSRYMEMCLYDPERGYYAAHAEQFGKAGDFYTSSDVHAVFGRLLARQFEEMWRALGSPAALPVVELGPGRGLFAQDVMDWSEKKFPEFFHGLHYALVEASPALRQRLAETLGKRIAEGRAKIFSSLEELPNKLSAPTIIFANEFFDALPVEVLSHRGELRAGCEQGRFVESFVPSSAAALEYLDRYSVHPEAGERVEAALSAQDYMESIAQKLGRGFVIIIDYGYTREEQLAGRHRGTVTAFRRHTISASPYEAPGEQDITAHVNFTALQSVAEKQGLEPLALLTQAQFLMGIGEANQFADAFEGTRLPQEQTKVALQLKHLVTPAAMGENFQVLVMGKGVDVASGRRLSGLKFAR